MLLRICKCNLNRRVLRIDFLIYNALISSLIYIRSAYCLVVSAETIPNPLLQNEERILINNKFTRTIRSIDNQPNNLFIHPRFTREYKTLRHIKTKLNNNNACIIKADKGNTLVIMDTGSYNAKVHDFISNHNIRQLNSDPTDKYVKNLNHCINKCTCLFNENTRRYLKPINAKAPIFTGLPKIHKPNTPIRPLVNFTTAPGFKTAKNLARLIADNLQLNNDHSITNNIDFINKIKTVKLKPNYKLVSFDIVDLYTNIPTDETLQLLRDNLHNNASISAQMIDELIDLLKVILMQNYFTFNGSFYSQDDGLAMGSPLSGLLADVYLNFYENTYLLNNNIYANKIIFYSRYVDDTFIIFDGTLRQVDSFKNFLNGINKNIQFTIETEHENTINFLDLTLTRRMDTLKFNIYRKPTATSHTIHADSHHPYSQKMAAYNSLIHRLLTVPLDNNDFQAELNTIRFIAVSNGYSSSIIDKLLKKHIDIQRKPRSHNETQKKFISAKYTYVMPKILSSVMNSIGYTMSFRTNNKLINILRPKMPLPIEEKTGIYKLICNDCNCFYIGQTGRGFYKRFREHIPKKTYNHNYIKSNYTRHLTLHNHNYTDFKSNLVPLHICNKGRFMNALEELEIYNAYSNDSSREFVLNEQLNFESNRLYDTALGLLNNIRSVADST